MTQEQSTKAKAETVEITLKHVLRAVYKIDRLTDQWWSDDLDRVRGELWILQNQLRNIQLDKRVYTNDGNPHYNFEVIHTEQCTAMNHMASSRCPLYRKQKLYELKKMEEKMR